MYSLIFVYIKHKTFFIFHNMWEREKVCLYDPSKGNKIGWHVEFSSGNKLWNTYKIITKKQKKENKLRKTFKKLICSRCTLNSRQNTYITWILEALWVCYTIVSFYLMLVPLHTPMWFCNLDLLVNRTSFQLSTVQFQYDLVHLKCLTFFLSWEMVGDCYLSSETITRLRSFDSTVADWSLAFFI